MSTSTSQWDPEAVLGIGQVSSGITCVGYAHSKNRRCHNAIAAENRERATNLLKQMSKMDVSSPEVEKSVEKSLKDLAGFLLCKNNHQDQSSSFVGIWRNKIKGFKAQEAANRDLIGEWDHIIRSSPAATHQWTALLEESLMNANTAAIQKTLKLLDLAQKREKRLQTQLSDLQTSNADLNREVESLQTQLSDLQASNTDLHQELDSLHTQLAHLATPVTSTSLAIARRPSTDSHATLTHQSLTNGNRQLLVGHGHAHNHIHLLRFQFELYHESVPISHQPHPQFVRLPSRSFFSSLAYR